MLTIDNDMATKFQIGELSKRAALSIDAIRFYERRQLLPNPTRTAGRFRLYTADDVERLKFVRQMQALGFSLEEIKGLIKLRSDKAHVCESVRDLLNSKLADVAAKIRDLQQLEAELKADLRRCNQAFKHGEDKKACTCPVLELTQ